MVFGLCSQRERLYSLLYTIQIFILTGMVYYYFQGSLGKTAPAHELAVESSQGRASEGLSAHTPPSCPSLQAMTPKAMGAPNDAAPKEESAVLSREEGQVGPPGEEPASLIPVAKGVTEKEEVARTPGWQENKKARKEMSVYVSEASEEDVMEERPGGWVPHLLRKLWLGWFPASDIPKTQSHE
ncbi:PREDICTED: uncharacterized protein LOC104991277 [Bison bison bison]|uniref:Uncharacterized protein LOC104991277 n=1 Tax=Bison bison bison TaxID=43346 RepID=A0A6P3HI64_BISBB|nr:PREDICTED: uncharacterized protein LOC104991277 [Bison bison bison]